MHRTGMPYILLWGLVILLLSASGLHAQISAGGTPPSFQRALKGNIQSISMGYVDVEALLAEDSVQEEMGMPYRFGYPFSVGYNLENSGTWEILPDGGRLWRLKISSPGAYSINLIYDAFRLPDGAELFIYNEDRSMVLGAFTSQNNKPWSEFATGLVKGDVCILEYYEPADVEFPGVISISSVVHGYKNLFSYKEVDEALGFGSSGSCNNNVNCPEGLPWQDDKRAIAMILTSGGSRICSGSLVNNVRQDLTPYFLTANHCLGGETTWIFMFNYESPTCANIDGPTWMTVSGSTLKATYTYSDFALLQLSSAPPDSYEVFYAGWSAVDTAASNATCIHHPRGDIKKISFEYDPLTSTSYLGGPGTGDSHWRVEDWDDGTTEPGSSGSPLFDPDHHIVGQLHGGYASCTSQTPDWFGKFSKSWDYGSTPSTRLKDWLDPDNTGTLILDGIDGAGVKITHTPLPNTKDTLNDYEVSCEITSPADLIPDSTLLYYQVNSVWTSVALTYTGADDIYNAYIPAQSPGTTVDYYLFAKNIEDYADTTETYTFYVIDYDIILDPLSGARTGAVDDTLWYDFSITNNGLFNDDISLELIGNAWPTAIMDATGSTEIASTGSLVPDAVFDFGVRVIVPFSYYGDTDAVELKATSGGNASVTQSAIITTTSAGQAVNIPFTDNFVSTTLDPAKWVYNNTVVINADAYQAPSEPYSLNFDGSPAGGDTVLSQAIDLKDESNVIFKYYYEQTGSGESPDTDDDLIFEFVDALGVWQEISRQLGSGPDMNEFAEVEINLPPEAFHSGFRLRIRNKATVGTYDDWFVDNIYIGHPSDYEFSVAPSFQSLYGPAGDSAVYSIWIYNEGVMEDSYSLVDSIGDWDVTFFDASGTNQITTTAVVQPLDSIMFLAKVAVPPATPLHVTDTATIYIRSSGEPTFTAYTLAATISAGFPAEIPWYETFPYDTLYTQRWFVYANTGISQGGLNEPSPLYSLNIDGSPDTATTQLIDLGGKSSVHVSYYYEAGGSGAAPAAGENVVVEYRNSSGDWIELQTLVGPDSVMTEFAFVSMELPADAYHSSFQLRFRSAALWTAGDWFIDNIRVDYPPDIAVSPSSLTEQVVKGDSSYAKIYIDNAGLGELFYSIAVNYHFSAGLFADLLASGMVEPASRDYPPEAYDQNLAKDDPTAPAYSGPDVVFNAGGPDNFGYYWIDSDEPDGPAFSWIDISSTGTDIISQLDDDNYVGPIDIGFDFKYYGLIYNQIYVGSNGIIGFAQTDMDERANVPIPATATPNAILAWLWDDLDPTDADNPGVHVYYQSFADKFVITFAGYPEYQASPGDVVTAQVILYTNNMIKYQYQTIGSGFSINEATVGIENHDGTDGLQVVYNSAYLHDNLAVQFYGQFDWLVPEAYSGSIPAGASDTVDCMFLNSEDMLPGIYDADVIISNNDPDNNPVIMTAEMELLGEMPYICGDANGDEAVNVSDAVHIINYIFVSGAAPDPPESADVNCDGNINVSDAVYIINYIFVEGPEPCADCPK
jgi:hypothetical protein